MDKNDELNNQQDGKLSQDNCNCESGCCPPKKKNPFRTILFAVIILAATGIIAYKLSYHPASASVKASCCPAGSASTCDTTKPAGTDTTKGSSCCPK